MLTALAWMNQRALRSFAGAVSESSVVYASDWHDHRDAPAEVYAIIVNLAKSSVVLTPATGGLE
jgi:hypothetical protein